MPAVGDVLDGAALLRWGQGCLHALERHRDEINALNVFPVADSDTGTNLFSTMRAAVRAAESLAADRSRGGDRSAADQAVGETTSVVAGRRAERDSGVVSAPNSDAESAEQVRSADAVLNARLSAQEVAGAMARAATIGARGNSGIILSQVLRGVAEAVCDGPLDEQTLREGLRRAALLVREALSSPVEGTMLTVLDCAAERAADCSERTLVAVALAAADGAAKALGETPGQLGVLRQAGVVDAGARGLLVLLDELVTTTGGQPVARPAYVRNGERGARPGDGMSGMVADSTRATTTNADGGAAGATWSVGTAAGASAATAGAAAAHAQNAGGAMGAPNALGPSGIGVRGGGPGGGEHETVEGFGGGYAPQYEVMYLLSGTDEQRVARLREQLDGLGDSVVVVGDGGGIWSAHVHCADAGAAVEAGLAAGWVSGIRIETLAVSAHAPGGPGERGILAVASGAGAVRLFEDAGAEVLEGEVTAQALLAGIRRLPHREVLVLPNGALPAHELMAVSVAARDGNRDVLMLPSASMVQGLAALSMHDGGRIAADDVFAMSEAAAGTRWGALRIAPERALTIVGTCEAGDGLGLVGHDVVVIDSDVASAGCTLLDRMLGLGGELVTMLIGAEAPQGLSEELAEHVGATFPGVEVVVYPGGQAGDLVQIGVE
ncbi:DAK2 domain-containing protein [Nocardia sp. NBC_01388]|uniref:DAK2 domain-containing protein n=1 Tax=Nocardia sp. NBC_01388 TaxID=2903596 RepID=UPI00324ACC81